MITSRQLVEFAKNAVAVKAVYWYGTYWNKCTSSKYNSKKKQYPSHYTSARASGYRRDIANGRMCCDCIGLIKGAAWTEAGAHEAKYNTNGCPDKSADGMLAWCKNKGMANGRISTIPEIPGLLLHKSGHAGVYIGNGKVIEAIGFDYDVKETALSVRGWTSWAKLPFVEYVDDVEPVAEPQLGDCALQKGDKNTMVEGLQTMLVALGYDLGTYGTNKNGVDGDFGAKTKSAVMAFQAANRLVKTGIADIETIAEIIEAAKKIAESENPEIVPAPLPIIPETDKAYIIDCLDLSSYNSAQEPKIDWQKIKDGAGFIIFRCGCTRVKTKPLGVGGDAYFERWAKKCIEYGIPFWVYYYSHAKSIAQAQDEARYSYNIAAKYNPIGYFMDCEESSLTAKRIGAWVDEMRKLGAARVGLYVAHNLYARYDLELDDDGFILISDADWIPRYGQNDGTFKEKYLPRFKCDLWQGTSVYRFVGIPDKTLDANKVTGQRRTLAWFRGEE